MAEKKKMLQTMVAKKAMDKITEVFGLDTRSISLLRIAVGITSLYDIYDRCRDLSAHYTDTGVLTRNTILNTLWSDYWFSFLMISGNWWYIAIVFAVHTLVALLFTVGYRTRLMHILLWAFTISAQTRNIIIGHSGDTLHVLILFWLLFLPVSDHFSVDAMFSETKSKKLKSHRINNVGCIAYMFQILIMYYAAHSLKIGSAWRQDYTAAYLALGLDIFRRPFGDVLLMFPTLLKISTWGVLWWQGAGPYLYFSPIFTGPLKLFVVFGFTCMHVGFGLSMRLGQFTFITMTGILGLIPGWAWDTLFNLLRTRERAGFRLFYLQRCKTCVNFAKFCETFLLIPGTQTIPVLTLRNEEEPCECGGVCEKDDALWLSCQNHDGVFLYNMNALKEIFKVSPILWPLSYINYDRLNRIFFFRFLARYIRECFHSHKEDNWSSPVPSRSFNKEDSFEVQVVKLTYQVIKHLCLNGFALVCFYIIFTRNATSLGSRDWQTPGSLYPLMYAAHLDQHWAMFTPSPPNSWWWFNIEGELGDHSKVELFANGGLFTHEPNVPHTFEKGPGNKVYLGFKNHRWFKFFENGYNYHASHETFRLEFGKWVCREYNKVHSGNQRLWKYNVWLMNEMDNAQHDGTRTFTGKQNMWSHLCYEQ